MAVLFSSWPLAVATIMASTLLIGSACSSQSIDSKSLPLVIDFVNDQSWRPLNDGVMGGLSEGRITWDEGMHWVGQTRLENNGGFSSVRAAWGEYNLKGLRAITIRCKGKGGPFKLTMEMSQRWWMPYAYASFEPSGEWQDHTIQAKDLTWSQAFTGDLETLPLEQSLGSIIRLGFMKYDGTAQPFDLEVASIRFE
ncbi:MAG: hypothetical protein CMD33_06490 [Flavobacteriales bacterium]|jgi:hypothetical protein|nr:hypothetical protein [Flavobacteriales bacterium]